MGDQPRRLDRMRERSRLKHYSSCAKHTDIHWIRRNLLFHDRYPSPGEFAELEQFLADLGPFFYRMLGRKLCAHT